MMKRMMSRGQIDAWVAEDENTYYMSTAKSLKVDRGYYYRVHCNHIAGNEYPYEEEVFCNKWNINPIKCI